MNIQLAKYKDIDEIANVIKNSLNAGGYGTAWLSELDRIEWHIDAKECYIAKNNDEIIGAMCLELLDTLEIESLGILEKYRFHGLGRKFIQKALDLAKKYKYNKVTLGSCKVFNAQGFYKKMGFNVIELDDGDFEFEYKLKRNKK